MEKDVKSPISKEKEGKLKIQLAEEFQTGWDFLAPKLKVMRENLRLYNNQRKDPSAVGDPLGFTTCQTLIAALYDDELTVTFLAREPGDEVVADNVNSLARYDYTDMNMDQFKYFQLWDMVNFGNAYIRMQEFNRKLKRPVPELWDPLTVIRDPDAQCMNGEIVGFAPARYFGRVLELTKEDLRRLPGVMNVNKISENRVKNDSLLDEAKQERNDAQNRETPVDTQNGTGDNQTFQFVEMYSHFDGELVQTLWSGNVEVLHQYKVIENGIIPIIKAPLFPISHDWDGTNVWDLVGDKQRSRAEILNLVKKAQKADLYPMYIYAEKRIRNKADLNFDFNKFIGASGTGSLAEVVQPMQKNQPNQRLISYAMDTLEKEAQQSMATPDIQQGMMTGEKRTLGELNLVTNRADARFSLSARVLGWSEKLFWIMWYGLYKKYFDKGIGEKIVRISGAYGNKLRPLTRDQIVMKTDPDLEVVSKKLQEAQNQRDLLSFEKFLVFLKDIPDANYRFAVRYHGKLIGLDSDVVDRLVPLTPDEMQAIKENEMLNDEKLPEVNPIDDDAAHLDRHRYANNNKYTQAHILTHKDNMRLKKLKPELFPQLRQQGQAEANGQAILEGGQGTPEASAPSAGSGLNQTNQARLDQGMKNNMIAQNNNMQSAIPQNAR